MDAASNGHPFEEVAELLLVHGPGVVEQIGGQGPTSIILVASLGVLGGGILG